MNYAQCGEDQNLRIKFSTLVITDISRCSKGHKNKLKWVTMFPFTKHSETILAVSPEILYTEPDELALLSANLFPS